MEKIEKLQSFLKGSPEDPFLQHALALEYIKMGNDSAAELLFVNILTRDPTYIGSYYHLASLYQRTGEIVNAKKWYESGIIAAKQSDDSHALNELRAAYEDFTDNYE